MHVSRVVNLAKRRRNSKKLEREYKKKMGTHSRRSQAFVALSLGLTKR